MAKKWDFFQLFLATNIQKIQVVAKNNYPPNKTLKHLVF